MAITLAAALLSGCASVSFTQLTPDLRPKAGAPEGAVYYMPKPYLLVTQLPYTALAGATVAAVAVPATDPVPPKKGGEAVNEPNAGWPAPDPNANVAAVGQAAMGGADEKASGGDATLAAGSDQSFGGSSEGYFIKLIYLPDMSRPMSVSMRSGLGSANLKPTFQNGWMLTGFDAGADSKNSEILTALAPLLTAYKTSGKAAADVTGGKGGGAAASLVPADTRQVLAPGLYEIEYDDQRGNLKSICARTHFTAQGSVPASGAGSCTK
ncbi:MAG TPA: hypothetical protein VF631_01310 [Allosphingosinicella sp.]|uniref:hypothetical protein n=1 Tax=Allosphingosinicella sp. TaxID=2823234 RepID=UPI002F29C851